MQLKVLSFNLRFDNPRDGIHAWPHRRDSVAEVIRQHQPLVFGIQEGLLTMLKDLDARLPEYGRVGEGRGSVESDEYSAVYYRKDVLEVVETNQIWLSETPELPGSKSWDACLPRICTWAVFQELGSERKFCFFNTHLDHEGSLAREKGAKLLWQTMAPYAAQNLPCILTGDFNSTPDSEPITFLRSKLVDALFSQGKGDLGTFHRFSGEAGVEPIDYIFCTQDITILDAHVLDQKVDGIWPSDHFPILAKITL